MTMMLGNVEDVALDAERAAAVADALFTWATGTNPGPEALDRFRAAAIVRELANMKWSDAIRKMRNALPS